jgi:solute carrier family 45 protein 1/2/4
MTLSPISGVDPDPTTQIPWPGARKRSDREHNAPGATTPLVNSSNASRRGSEVSRPEMNRKRRQLSTSDLFNLSISMAGAQIAWTVELG